MNPTAMQILRAAMTYLADPLFRPGTGENHCRECRQTVKYCDADDGRRLSDKGRCAGAVARAALEAAAKAPGIDREQLFKWIVANDHRAGDLRQRAIDDVLDAVDACQRGAKP